MEYTTISGGARKGGQNLSGAPGPSGRAAPPGVAGARGGEEGTAS